MNSFEGIDLDEPEPIKSKPIIDSEITIYYKSKIDNIYSVLSNDKNIKTKITKELLTNWETNINLLINDIKTLKNNRPDLLAIYRHLLLITTPLTIDPLQYTTFDLISHAIIDNILLSYPKNYPITDLIDDITDCHLNFIEDFRLIIDDGGDEGYSQSSRQEFLCYQFAGLMKSVYKYLTRSLGDEFDKSPTTQELRLNNWVAPIFARMQRRFVRFSTSYVEDKIEEILQTSFDQLFQYLTLDVTPKYRLIADSSTNIIDRTNYPDWEIADLIIKLLRITIADIPIPLNTLEIKVLRTFQSDISYRMRPLGKILENIINQNKALILSEKPNNKYKYINEKELKSVEDMLNIAHSCVAAVFSIWHVRFNIVGVTVTTNPTETSTKPEVVVVKDYLSPVIFTSYEALSDSLPKYLRNEVYNNVKDLTKQIECSSFIKAAALLASSVRITASEELRALLIFNSDPDDWPGSRDNAYIAVLATVLTNYILCTSNEKPTNQSTGQFKYERILYENLIAMAALEEAIGVREPRKACVDSYKTTIKQLSMYLTNPNTNPTQVDISNLSTKLKQVEKGLAMCLRLPIANIKSIRFQAFKDTIDDILLSYEKDGKSGGLLDIQRVYPLLSQVLDVPMTLADSYIKPLALNRFDKSIGSILLNADIAISLPNSGQIYLSQIDSLANQIELTKPQARTRVIYLSTAVFISYIEVCIDENRRMNNDRVIAILRKVYNLLNHPLLLDITNDPSNLLDKPGDSLLVRYTNVCYERLGSQLVIELLRLLDGLRKQLAGNTESNVSSQGWGASNQQIDKEFNSFINDFQQELLKVYTIGSMNKGI